MLKLFYADTETTGLDPKEQEVFQFAFILVINGKVVEEHDLKIRPERWDKVSKEALEVTGKTIEELKTYPTKRDTFNKLKTILKKHVDPYNRNDKMIWIGQNGRFDTDFVRAWFAEMGDKYFGSWWDARPADLITLAVAARMRGIINPENFKQQTICESLGFQFKAHDALDDVRALRKAFTKLVMMMEAPKAAEEKAAGAK